MGGIGWGLLHRLGDHLEPCLARQRRHPRGSRLVALEPRDTLVKIPCLPAPDGRLRGLRPPHDLKRAMAVRCGQHDLGPPDQLARRITIGDQCSQLGTVVGVQIQANVMASHTPTLTHPNSYGNPMSGGEH